MRYSPAGPTGLDRCRAARGRRAGRRAAAGRAHRPGADFDHPGLVEAPEVLVLTPAAWPAEAEAEARRRGIEHRALADLTLAATLAHLRDRGRRRISVEAGPTTARALFTGPALLDQLLSTCRARACRRASRVRSSPGGRRSRRACPPAPPPGHHRGRRPLDVRAAPPRALTLAALPAAA
ncbi:MAG: hypothetical protein R3F43_09500 [bacterium]